ncbi:unnamed protein product [Notodromas monacha]|uniref:Uncharacterized protein n=1 Tax=Notodromas monacha TaxID=399045 RepID=A0A7R9GAF2_9CRUS|nr:unnamed protein product [Notodromas monacha]CAG0914029.1 unnamed protein product [Notodromas monacha]
MHEPSCCGWDRKQNLGGSMAICYCYIIRTPTGAFKLLEITLSVICLSLARSWNILLGFNLEAFAKAGTMAQTQPEKALEQSFQLLASNDMHNTCIATFIAYLIITPCILIVYLRGQTHVQASDLEFLLNLIGGMMFMGTGGVTLATWITSKVPLEQMRTNAVVVGSLSIINGLVYFVDAVIAYQNK